MLHKNDFFFRFSTKKKERREYEQPRRPESRAPTGPNALRAYSPARTRAAETFPSASWAFEAEEEAEAAEDDDDDDAEDNVLEEVEKGRRRCSACVRCRLRRNVVTIMSSFCFERLRVCQVVSELVVVVRLRGLLTFGWVHPRRFSDVRGGRDFP